MSRGNWICACVAMAFGLSFGGFAETVSESFESETIGATPSSWTGYCWATNQVGTYAGAAGYPITGDGVTHTKMLAVEGTAVRAYSETGSRMVDLLVRAEELPDEELPAATGDEQIKFAFDTNGCVNLYHKLNADSAAAMWSQISTNVYSSGTWVRVTFVFSYGTTPMCQVKVNGSACVSEYGYAATNNLVHPGSWYHTAKACSVLKQIDFAGCGAVDDVVNGLSPNEGGAAPAYSGEETINSVDHTWLEEYGFDLTSEATTQPAPGGSGYTVKEAYDAGTDPYSENKLYVTNAAVSGENLVLTFNGYSRTYTVKKASAYAGTYAAVEATSVSSNKTANTTTWTGPMPTEALAYYEVVSDLSAETVNRFAIKKIASSNATTLVSLPWKSLGPSADDPASITAANVVMPVNLAVGDWLLYYDSGYKGWCWNGSSWVATAQSGVNGLDVSAAASDAQLARGQAVWLVRTTDDSRDLTKPFYLYGQYYKPSSESAVSVSSGNLVASPDMEQDFVVSASGKISNALDGDVIRVPSTVTDGATKFIERRNGAWGTDVKTVSAITGPDGGATTKTVHTWSTEADDLTIPAGQGFMYVPTNSNNQAVSW